MRYGIVEIARGYDTVIALACATLLLGQRELEVEKDLNKKNEIALTLLNEVIPFYRNVTPNKLQRTLPFNISELEEKCGQARLI